ncbi:MAG: hypothetical protein AB7I30_17510 [Isosphaeraceae bacterium]
MRVSTHSTFDRWALPFCALFLVTVALPSRSATAAALPSELTYSTSARFSGVGLPISFEGVQNETVQGEGPIPLGRFVIQKPESGGDVVFSDAAFAVEFNAPSYHKVEANSDPTSALSKIQFDGVFTVEGHLNGTVFADGTSTLKATIDGVQATGLDQSSLDRTYVDALPFSVSDLDVVPELDLTSGPGGLAGVDLAAQIVDPSQMAVSTMFTTDVRSIQPVPEPSSLAVYLAAACALGLSRRRFRRLAV